MFKLALNDISFFQVPLCVETLPLGFYHVKIGIRLHEIPIIFKCARILVYEHKNTAVG